MYAPPPFLNWYTFFKLLRSTKSSGEHRQGGRGRTQTSSRQQGRDTPNTSSTCKTLRTNAEENIMFWVKTYESWRAFRCREAQTVTHLSVNTLSNLRDTMKNGEPRRDFGSV